MIETFLNLTKQDFQTRGANVIVLGGIKKD